MLVENNNLAGVKIFTLFVGSHRKRVQEELDLFLPYLEAAGAIYTGHFKYPKTNPKLPADELTQCTRELVGSLS